MASLLAFFPCNFWCGRSIICSEILSAGEAPFKPPISPSRHPKSPLSKSTTVFFSPTFLSGITHFDISLKAVNRGTPAALKQSTEDIYLTGGAFDFKGATESLTSRSLPVVKKVILVRHGLSSWNAESRIQGSSDQSTLSTNGALQSEKCGKALSKLKFDRCFASPISRAKASAEIIWKGRQQPLVFLDALKEANLLFLEGMKNVDARTQYPEMYKAWREDPENFNINGVYPVVELWGQARRAWKEIVSTPGELFLLVSHKSILRAMISTALGLGPNRFRAIDINNCGISVFVINDRGEPMLQCLNRTAHLHMDDVYY